jgi:hemolysin activation/secretion protein
MFLYFASSSYAISPSDIEKINNTNNNILLKDKERRNFEKNLKEKNIKNIKVDSYKIDKNKKLDSKCFIIKQINFYDNKMLNEKDFQLIVQKYNNKCLAQTDISNILKEINNIYIEKGYITSKAYLKEQNLDDGILKIHVIEGKVNNITINNTKGSELITAFPNLQNNVLNLRDIEMGLDQINRLSRNNATLDLQAAQQVGYSDINIVNVVNNSISGQASINSNGIKSTGKGVGSLQLYLDNPLGYNSQLSFNFNGALRQTDEKKSRGYTIEWSIPYGYFLFKTGYRNFLYRSTIEGDAQNYISSGESLSYFTNLEYTTFRNQTTVLKAILTLNMSQNLNFIANELIQTSSTKFTVGSLGMNLVHQKNDTQYSFNFVVHQGLDLFDPILNSDDSYKKAQFTKFTTYLSASSNLLINDILLNLNSSLSGQYSNDKLYSTELFSMGGFYSVRGFNYMSYYGEIGAYMHNDLLYQSAFQIFNKQIIFSPYFGLDAGVVEYDEDIYKHMIGMGIGAKISIGNLSVNYDIGIPLYAYEPIREEEFASSFSIQYRY